MLISQSSWYKPCWLSTQSDITYFLHRSFLPCREKVRLERSEGFNLCVRLRLWLGCSYKENVWYVFLFAFFFFFLFSFLKYLTVAFPLLAAPRPQWTNRYFSGIDLIRFDMFLYRSSLKYTVNLSIPWWSKCAFATSVCWTLSKLETIIESLRGSMLWASPTDGMTK